MSRRLRLPIPEYPRQLSSIAWIELDHQTIADWFLEGARNPLWKFVQEPGPRDLSQLLEVTSPANKNPRSDAWRYVLIPAGQWTGLLNNNGGDLTTIHMLLRDYPARLVRLMWETVENGFPGGQIFTIHGDTLATAWPFAARDIRVIKDRRWSFEAHGDPLPFEDLEAYKSRKISDRLTGPQLMRYGAALGIPNEVDLETSYVLSHYFLPAQNQTQTQSPEPGSAFSEDFTPSRPPYPRDLEIGSLLTVEEFFTAHTSEADIGCNLEHHPGISFFRTVLTAVQTDPTTNHFGMHVSDTDEDGYPFCDSVFVMTTAPASLTATAAALHAELLQLADMMPPPPPFGHPPPGNTALSLWWD